MANLFRSIMVLAIAISMTACEGAEGPVGPEGPQGAAGLNGQDGEDGQDASFTIVSFVIDSGQFSGSGNTESYSRAMPEITSSVVSSGVVIAYTNLGSTSDWYSLPLTLPATGNVAVLSTVYSTGTFGLILQHEASGSFASIFDGHTIRVAILESASKNLDQEAIKEAIARY